MSFYQNFKQQKANYVVFFKIAFYFSKLENALKNDS